MAPSKLEEPSAEFPLHLALAQGKPAEEVMALLFVVEPGDPGTADGHGSLPLHHAAANKVRGPSSWRSMTLLGFRRVRLISIHALQAEDAVVQALIDTFPSGVQARTRDGRLPLHFACEFGASETVVRLLTAAAPQEVRLPSRVPFFLPTATARQQLFPAVTANATRPSPLAGVQPRPPGTASAPLRGRRRGFRGGGCSPPRRSQARRVH